MSTLPAERGRRIARAYQWLSAFDYFADFSVCVVAVLILQARGLATSEVFATVAAVWLVEALFEIPTGVIADRVGRRRAVMISMALRAIGYATLFCSGTAGGAVAGVLIAALGGTFSSGALEAWAVDGARASGAVVLDGMFTRARIAENVGLVLGTMCGAGLACVDVAAPYLLAALASAAGIALSARLMTEQRRRASPSQAGAAPRSARESVTRDGGFMSAARALASDRVLTVLIVATAAMYAFRGIPGGQWTVHFESLASGGVIVLGLVRCATALLEIPVLVMVTRRAGRGESARRHVVLWAASLGGLFLVVAALSSTTLVSLLAFTLFSVSHGVCLPSIRVAINERLEARDRATMLSFVSLATGALTAGGLLLAGAVVGDLGVVSLSWPVAALGFTIFGFVAATAVRPVRAERAAARDGLPEEQSS